MFLLHFSRFKTFLFFGHSKIKVRSCVLCVYAGTPLDVSTKYTANNFSRLFFQMCFTGPSMGNSADADQMSTDVALHLGLHC